MNAEEFVRTCQLCGYASRKAAREYSREKTELTSDDLVEVFRQNERKASIQSGKVNHSERTVSGEELIDRLGARRRGGKQDI